MENIIINGYIIMWATLALLIWAPAGFFAIEASSDFNSESKRVIFRNLLVINLILIALDILTAPVQYALITTLWRG